MRRAANGVAIVAAFAVTLAAGNAIAGEIPGIRPLLPTLQESDLEVSFGNDFLGRGGSVDDFRTHQVVISAKIADRWRANIDYSILTFSGEPEPGRLDQVAISLGYELVNLRTETRVDSISLGSGLRSVGRFAGDRIQNGFHRIISSEIEDLPYTGNSDGDLTAWIDARRYRSIRAPADDEFMGAWQKGYWLQASSLVTTAGQWDSSATVLAVLSKPGNDIWLGIRSDWREGYDDVVLRETASAEDDLSIVLGVRFGPLVIETVQQVNNDASYGQLRLVSSENRMRRHGTDVGRTRAGMSFSILMPDVQLRLTGRVPLSLLTAGSSSWRAAAIAGLEYGEPQYKSDASLFVRSRQLDAAIEFERPLTAGSDWLHAYWSAGAGWRDEKLVSIGETGSGSAMPVGRATITAGAGLRFDGAGSADGWRLRIQLGLVGRRPLSDANVDLNGRSFRVQRSAIDLELGVAVDF